MGILHTLIGMGILHTLIGMGILHTLIGMGILHKLIGMISDALAAAVPVQRKATRISRKEKVLNQKKERLFCSG